MIFDQGKEEKVAAILPLYDGWEDRFPLLTTPGTIQSSPVLFGKAVIHKDNRWQV